MPFVLDCAFFFHAAKVIRIFFFFSWVHHIVFLIGLAVKYITQVLFTSCNFCYGILESKCRGLYLFVFIFNLVSFSLIFQASLCIFVSWFCQLIFFIPLAVYLGG